MIVSVFEKVQNPSVLTHVPHFDLGCLSNVWKCKSVKHFYTVLITLCTTDKQTACCECKNNRPLTWFHVGWSGRDEVQSRWVDHALLWLPH